MIENIVIEDTKLIETNNTITTTNFIIIVKTVSSPISEKSISNLVRNDENNYDKEIIYSPYVNLIMLSICRAETLIQNYLYSSL